MLLTSSASDEISEISSVVAKQPENKVKALFGIKTTSDNKKYQDVFTKMFLKNGTTDYSRLDAAVKAAQNAGAYPNTEFEVCDLHEYVETPTSFDEPSDDMPASAFEGEAFNPFATPSI